MNPNLHVIFPNCHNYIHINMDGIKSYFKEHTFGLGSYADLYIVLGENGVRPNIRYHITKIRSMYDNLDIQTKMILLDTFNTSLNPEYHTDIKTALINMRNSVTLNDAKCLPKYKGLTPNHNFMIKVIMGENIGHLLNDFDYMKFEKSDILSISEVGIKLERVCKFSSRNINIGPTILTGDILESYQYRITKSYPGDVIKKTILPLSEVRYHNDFGTEVVQNGLYKNLSDIHTVIIKNCGQKWVTF